MEEEEMSLFSDAFSDAWSVISWPARQIGDKAREVGAAVGTVMEAGFDAVGLTSIGDASNWIATRVGERVQAAVESEITRVQRLGHAVDDLFDKSLWTDFGGWL